MTGHPIELPTSVAVCVEFVLQEFGGRQQVAAGEPEAVQVHHDRRIRRIL
jgi:hypothetical protein